MAVTIVKPKAKSEEQVDSAQIVQPEVIDEYASLRTKLDKKKDKLKPLEKKVGSLEKGILGAVDAVLDPSASIDLQGEENELKVGPQGQRAELVDTEKAMDILGQELFLKLAKISMTDLKAYMTPEQISEVTESKYAIKRRVKVEAL